MQISKFGLAFIRQWEGVRLKAYKDTGGVWTIGVGHTSMAGPPAVTPSLTITLEEADAILAKDLSKVVNAVNNLVTVPLTQMQFDMLVSFTFNCGTEAFKDSTLLRKLNAGDYQGAAKELLRWIHDDGKVIQGLVNRRQAEYTNFSSSASKGGDPISPEAPQGEVERKNWFQRLLEAIVRLFGG